MRAGEGSEVGGKSEACRQGGGVPQKNGKAVREKTLRSDTEGDCAHGGMVVSIETPASWLVLKFQNDHDASLELHRS